MWALSFAISLVLGLIVGRFMIPTLHRLKFGQSIREEGPKSHIKKQGTPTMGGILFMLTVPVTLLLTGQFYGVTWFLVGCAFLFGLIGLTDDSIKIIMRHNEGLTPKQKMVFQLVISILVLVWAALLKMNVSDFWLPVFNIVLPVGVLYWPIMIFIMIGTTNSSNLTDGLDGLLTTVTVVILVAYFAITKIYAEPHTLVAIAAMLGACLAFLFYNHYPAKVFMGDTGSFFLGGFVVGLSIVTKTELLIPVICFTYMMEAISVMIQVFSFKKFGRRVFKMTPIHHHFQEGGKSEVQVVFLFAIITIVTCLAAVGLYWTEIY